MDLRTDLNPEDVKPGMTREEVTAIAGAPSLTITLPEARSEQLMYLLKSGGSLDIVLEKGTVARVEKRQ